MNVMFADRQFLLVPYVKELSLIDRLILGNQRRTFPYDLSALIDARTLGTHGGVSAVGDYVEKAYAFYMPTKDCPLTYRELALWYLLWSLQPAKARKHSDHPYTFWNAYAGLEDLVGLGQRQASELGQRLQEHDLIRVKKSWFHLLDYKPYAHWFRPIDKTASAGIPPEFMELEKLRRAAEQPEPQPDPIEDDPTFNMAHPVYVNGHWVDRWMWADLKPEDKKAIEALDAEARAKKKALAPEVKETTIDTSQVQEETNNDNATIPKTTDSAEDDESFDPEKWCLSLGRLGK